MRLISQQIVPDSNNVKLPSVAIAGNMVSVSGGVDERRATGWVKDVAAPTFGAPFTLGDAIGQPNYATSSVAGRDDGTFTYAWISQGVSGPIQVRQRGANGQLSASVNATGGGEFFFVAGATNNAGTTVLTWNGNGRFRYVASTGGNLGAWPLSGVIANNPSVGRPQMASGPNNQIGVTFFSDGNIYAGLWNGSGFTMETVSQGGFYDADPTISFLPDGSPVVAWRRVEGGMFFAVRQANGSWPSSRVTDMTPGGPAGVSVDAAGNIAFSWVVNGVVYAAYRSGDGVAQAGPFRLSSSGDSYFEAGMKMLITDQSLIHVVAERFTGSGLRTDYFLLSAQGLGVTPPLDAVPVIANGAEVVSAPQSVSVAFTGVEGTPTQVRWNWGTPPTDANPWTTYQTTISVPVPANIQSCQAYRLYTQVREGDRVQEEAKSDTVAFDNAVQARVQITNPYQASTSALFTPLLIQLLDLGTDRGASSGHPDYTRDPAFYLLVDGTADCSGIKEFRVDYSGSGNFSRPYGLVNNSFVNILPILNAPVQDGEITLGVQVRDTFDNALLVTRTLVLDRTPPVLASGQLYEVTPDENANIMSTLTFSNVVVTDAYPGGYWGVWLANSLTEVTNPLTNTNLIWYPIEVVDAWNADNSRPAVVGWSLASGLGLSLTQLRDLNNPTFHVYARFLDGAGNPTPQVISKTVTINGSLTFPQVHLPLVRR
ncbi:MAG: hypothetical protein EI684_07610 [Candidatus Viridilinea halotolerans]|uniref:Uncharacterized protein n=1 Tax=Candidatus Viridilinea halotolerans TaxID=2491704 RepID=A0A426U354_9CHLR|nr:MAG: hypothetical protein EI684_07610 [Candidatus Viridilinea halotolerans]